MPLIGFTRAVSASGFSDLLVWSLILAFSLFTLVSGIGLLLGKAWGWWLGVLYYFYRAAGYVLGIVITMLFAILGGGLEDEAGSDLIRSTLRAIGSTVTAVLFYNKNVIQYYGIADHVGLGEYAWREIVFERYGV